MSLFLQKADLERVRPLPEQLFPWPTFAAVNAEPKDDPHLFTERRIPRPMEMQAHHAADISEHHPFSPLWPHFLAPCEFQMFESRREQALPAGQGGGPARLTELGVFSLEKAKRGFYQYPQIPEGRCQGMEQFLLSC